MYIYFNFIGIFPVIQFILYLFYQNLYFTRQFLIILVVHKVYHDIFGHHFNSIMSVATKFVSASFLFLLFLMTFRSITACFEGNVVDEHFFKGVKIIMSTFISNLSIIPVHTTCATLVSYQNFQIKICILIDSSHFVQIQSKVCLATRYETW